MGLAEARVLENRKRCKLMLNVNPSSVILTWFITYNSWMIRCYSLGDAMGM